MTALLRWATLQTSVDKASIYVGAGEEGLSRLEGGKCKVVKDDVTSYCFSVVGDSFAIGGGNEVGFFDGKSFDYVELEPIYED